MYANVRQQRKGIISFILFYSNVLSENGRVAVSMLESNLARATTILHLIESRHCSETVRRDGLNARKGFDPLDILSRSPRVEYSH